MCSGGCSCALSEDVQSVVLELAEVINRNKDLHKEIRTLEMYTTDLEETVIALRDALASATQHGTNQERGRENEGTQNIADC